MHIKPAFAAALMTQARSRLERPHWQAMALAFTTGLSQVITAAMTLLVARSVSPSSFASVGVIMGLGVVGVGLLDFGSNEFWVREFSREKNDGPEMFGRLSTKMIFTAVLAIPLLAWGLLHRHSLIWTLGLTLLFLQFEQSMQVPSRGAARGPIVSLTMLADRIAAFCAVLVLGWAGMGVGRLLVSLAIGNLVGGLLLIPEVFRLIPNARLHIANPWKGSFHYGVFSLSTSVQSLDVPLLRMAGGALPAGLYGAVNRWTAPLQLLISAFAQSSIPFVAGAASLRDGWAAIRRGALILMGAFVLMLVFIAFAPWLTRTLLGSQYSGAASVLRLLSISTGLVIFNQPMAMMMQATGRDRSAAMAILAGVLTQLGAILLLAPRHGGAGAASASVIGQVVMAGILWRGLAKAYRQERRPRRAQD